MGTAPDEARTTLTAVLDEIVAQRQDLGACSEKPCHDPLCPIHAGEDLERLRSAVWAPAAGAQPWQALQDGTLELGSVLDHTILRPEATPEDIEAGCREAMELKCAAFCTNLIHLPLVARLIKGSAVRVCSVVGFPLGAAPTAIKAEETRWAIGQGAGEIDMVIPIGLARAKDYHRVVEDIREVAKISHDAGAHCKVILETALLTTREKIAVCLLALRAEADFVKTSTGYSKFGATVDDVALMRLVVGNAMGVKAAGGIRTRDLAMEMIRSGANRIGTSSSRAIMSEQPLREG